jgi:hypothetical protein
MSTDSLRMITEPYQSCSTPILQPIHKVSTRKMSKKRHKNQNAHRQNLQLIMQQEGSALSDIVNSCEYLTSEKLCLAVSESSKAKAARQARCKNEEKMTCCYLCMFVMDCPTPCQFLGNSENGSPSLEVEKTNVENTSVEENKTEDQIKNDSVPCCPLCNTEMSQTRTKFRIDGWEGNKKPADYKPEEVLPVIVCLCPKCGKIELKADKK